MQLFFSDGGQSPIIEARDAFEDAMHIIEIDTTKHISVVRFRVKED